MQNEQMPSRDTNEKIAFGHILGTSKAFTAAMSMLRQFSNVDAVLLISGESGTGKELFARASHYLSPRRERPFIPVNCGAIPDNLFENELFGHERGAYTDASGRQLGYLHQANGGTLFLDEIDSLSLSAQVKLLRFMED